MRNFVFRKKAILRIPKQKQKEKNPNFLMIFNNRLKVISKKMIDNSCYLQSIFSVLFFFSSFATHYLNHVDSLLYNKFFFGIINCLV